MFACIMMRGATTAPQDFAQAHTLLAALTPYQQDDVQGSWTNDRMLMVQALTWNTRESRHEKTPETCKDTGRVIISWCRLDNRNTLCAQLGLEMRETLTDPQIILASHRKWGADCADKLEGDFSFVIYDPNTSQTFCARDSIGARPFFYYLDKDVFIAASTAAIFPLFKTLPISPSRAWMARYMADAPHPMSETAFENVNRLTPAHHMLVTNTGPAEPREYFQFKDLAPRADTRNPKYVEAYKEVFHQAVENAMRSDFLIGAESSGGLDSSSIIGHAVHHLPHDIDDFHCFGMCNLDEEPAYLLQTSLHCGIRHNHITTHALLHEDEAALERVLRVLGYPAEHNQAQWHTPILRQCEGFGIRTLLCGYGGDEMVTNQAGALYKELFHNRQYKTLAREMPGNFVTRWLRYFRMLKRFSSTKTESTAPAAIATLMKHALLQKAAFEEFEIEKSFKAGHLIQNQAKTLNEHMLRGPAFDPRRVARLEACALTAQSYKVDYRWPLYDRQLIQQFLRTPAIEKRKKTMGRYLHRRATSGSIPDKITWKQSKNLGGLTTKFTDREIPECLIPSSVSHELATLLNLDSMASAHAEAIVAKSKNDMNANSVVQLNSLWRADLLRRWLNFT